jgi:hypothetical protein
MATLSINQISSAINFPTPGRGAEQWHNGWEVDLSPFQKLDKYARFRWYQLESGQNQYNFAVLDSSIKEVIDRGGKFGFGVMTVCDCPIDSTIAYGGARSSYPQYLHNLMQAESVKDKVLGGQWVPNWNSNNYLSRLEALHKAINNWLETTSYKGVRYKDAISYIDIRGFGQWGEWHLVNIEGQVLPTVATYKRIIDAHLNGYPDIRMVAMIAGLNGGSVQFSVFPVPAEVSYYLLTAKNNAGEIGWRRDSLGSQETYYADLLENNKSFYNNTALKTLIMNKWQKAPIVGEPNCGAPTAPILSQVRMYHMMSFGNGNYCLSLTSTDSANVRAAALAAGYRLTLAGGSAALTSDQLAVTLNWQNLGIAPTYEKWDVEFTLRNNSTGVTGWKGISTFSPSMFLPGSKSVSDVFSVDLPTGTYTLSMRVVDPIGYRKPLSLAITGQQTDGSYILGSFTVTNDIPDTTSTTTTTTGVIPPKSIVSIQINYSDGSFKLTS